MKIIKCVMIPEHFALKINCLTLTLLSDLPSADQWEVNTTVKKCAIRLWQPRIFIDQYMMFS